MSVRNTALRPGRPIRVVGRPPAYPWLEGMTGELVRAKSRGGGKPKAVLFRTPEGHDFWITEKFVEVVEPARPAEPEDRPDPRPDLPRRLWPENQKPRARTSGRRAG